MSDDISIFIEIMESVMPALNMTNSERLNYLFSMMRRALALCCDREAGKLPTTARSVDAARC